MKKIQDIYSIVSNEGYYTKSFDEFQKQMQDPSYRNKVESVLKRDELWDDDMLSVFGNGQLAQEPSLKKKEPTGDSVSEDGSWEYQGLTKEELLSSKKALSDIPEANHITVPVKKAVTYDRSHDIPKEKLFESPRPISDIPEATYFREPEKKPVYDHSHDMSRESLLQITKPLSDIPESKNIPIPSPIIKKELPKEIEDQISTLTPELIGRSEENVVPEMQYRFGPLGFKFKENGVGDHMLVTSPDGATKEVNLDAWFSSTDESTAKDLQKFIRSHALPISNIDKLAAQYQGENKIYKDQKEVDADIYNAKVRQKNFMENANKFMKQKAEMEDERKALEATPEGLIGTAAFKSRVDTYNAKIPVLQDMARYLEADMSTIEHQQQKLNLTIGKYTAMKEKQGGDISGAVKATLNEFIGGLAKDLGVSEMRLFSRIDVSARKNANNGIPPIKELMDNRDLTLEAAKAIGLDFYTPTGEIDIPEWYKNLSPALKKSFGDAYYDKLEKAISYGKLDPLTGERSGGVIENFKKDFASILEVPGVTKEYLQKLRSENWLADVGLSTARSVGAIVGPGGKVGAATRIGRMFAQNSASVLDEMNSNPEFENVSENEKLGLVTTLGVAQSVLEELGFRHMIAKKGMLNGLVAKILGMNPNVTSKTFAEFVRNEMQPGLAKGLVALTGGFLAEAETGIAQEMSDIGIKKVYEEWKNNDNLFKDPKSIAEATYQILDAGLKEGVGGMMMTALPAASTAMTGKGFHSMSDEQFEMYRLAANDVTIQNAFIANLMGRVNSGEITRKQAKETIDNYRASVGLFNSLSEDITDIGAQKDAMNLLREKKALEEKIDGKDPALSAPIKNRINEINNLLTKISENAIQEQAASQVPVQPTTGVGEKMEEGVSEPNPSLTTEQEERKKTIEEAIANAEEGATTVTIGEETLPIQEAKKELDQLTSLATNAEAKTNVVEVLKTAPEGSTFTNNENEDVLINGNEDQFANLYSEALNTPDDQRTDVQKSIVNTYNELVANQQPISEPIAIHELEDLSDVESRVKTPIQKAVVSGAKTIVSALKTLMPGIQIYLHEDERSYDRAIKPLKGVAGSRGNFEMSGNRIDINLTRANARTLAHEAAHAVLYKIFGENTNAFKAFHKSLSTAISSMGSQDFVGDDARVTTVKKYLNNFISRYKDKSARPEEYSVELAGILTENAGSLSLDGWRKIALVVRDFVSRVTGGKIKLFEKINDTKDIVDFFNSMAKGFREGGDIQKAPARLRDKFGHAETKEESSKPQRVSAEDVLSLDVSGKKKVTEAASELEKAVDVILLPSSPSEHRIQRFLINVYQDLRYFLNDYKGDTGLDWYTNKIKEFSEKLKDISDIAIKNGGMPEENSLRDKNNMDLFNVVLALSSIGVNPRENVKAAFQIWKTFDKSSNTFSKYQPGKVSFRTNIPDGKGGYLAPSGEIINETKNTYKLKLPNGKVLDVKKSTISPLFHVVYTVNGKEKSSDLRLIKKSASNYLFKTGGTTVKIALSDISSMEEIDSGIVGKGWTTKGNIVAINLDRLESLLSELGNIESTIKWLNIKHPISELRKYNKGLADVNGNKGKINPVGERIGSYIIGEKLGAFHQNVAGTPSELTMDLWWSRTWNRYMGTLLGNDEKGNPIIQETPRNDSERNIMRKAASIAANALGLEIHEFQAALWYLEQQMYKRMGAAVESYSFVDGVNQLLLQYGKTNKEIQPERYGIDSSEVDKRRENAATRAANIIFREGGKEAKGRIEAESGIIREGADEGVAKSKSQLITDKKILSKMTEDDQGNFLFYHYAPSKISGKIDPKYFGRNLKTGRDERPGIGISMYYTRPDYRDVGGDYGYVVRIPKENVYPFNEDPLGLYDKAEAEFKKMYPDQAFDPNKQVAFVSKEAAKAGYPMTIAKWGKELRAQTTEALKPEWYERPKQGYYHVYDTNPKVDKFVANEKKGKSKSQVLSNYRDNRRFKLSDLKYPDTVFGRTMRDRDIRTAINFYDKIVRVFNKKFDRDLKLITSKKPNDFRVTVEYETGLRPKYFSYPTSKMGEHVVVDAIDKNTPLTSLRHELIHEMLVKNITDKFERINNMDKSAEAATIDEVQRGRAYNYTLEDVFFERVVENIERLPDFKDTFPMDTYATDVVNRLVSELGTDTPTKNIVDKKLAELLEGANPWLSKNITEAINKADFSKPLAESVPVIGKYFSQRFDQSKDILPKELQRKIYEFTEVFNSEYQGVVTRLSKSQLGERKLTPLPGAPTKVKDVAGPDPSLVSVAEKYAKENGIDLRRQSEYVNIDENFSKRLADAYEKMKHAPNDKNVKEAYADLIEQTKKQYDALVNAGYEFTFFDSTTDPYKGNPWDAMRDLRKNKRMAVYGTYDGYGTEGITGAAIEDNPMLADTGLKWADQNGVEHPVTANDLFRAVHDAFGHGLEGAGFRARGEENAWQAHVRLFTGPAIAAITTETRGQNSWLNYGPHGEKNRTANLENTVFAEQKTGLMPEWTWTENIAGNEGEVRSKSQLTESEMPGYERMMKEVRGIISKSKTRGVPVAKILDNVINYVKGSNVYEKGTDIQREKLIREIRKMFKKSERSAPSFNRLFGIVKDVKNITMQEKDLLKKQIRDLMRGAKDAKNAMNEARTFISDSLRDIVKGGQLSSKQAAAVLRMASKINLLKAESVNRFVDYATKVFNDADYADKIKQARLLAKNIKVLSNDKSKDPYLRDMAKRFIQIDPTLVDNINEYTELASRIQSKLRGSTIRGEKINWSASVDLLGAKNYIDEALLKQDKKRKEMLLEGMSQLLEGIDTENMSADDIKDLIDSIIEGDISKTKKYNTQIIKDMLRKAFNANAAIIQSMLSTEEDPITGYPVTFTDTQRQVLQRFINMDLDLLAPKVVLEAIDKLSFFIQNQGDFRSTAGMEVILAAHDAEVGLNKLASENIIAKAIRKYFSPTAGRIMLRNLTSIPAMFERLFKGVTRGAKVMRQLGITDAINGKAMAEHYMNTIAKTYVKAFYKTKPNGNAFNTAQNNIERGMVAFMIRNVIGTEGQMRDEFNRRKSLIEQSIEVLRKGDEQEQAKAEMYQLAYDKLVKESNNIADIESKCDKINLEAVKWWVNEWDSQYDNMKDVAANVYNKLLEKDINYTPDRYKKLNTVEDDIKLGDNESVFDFNNGAVYKKESGSLMEIQRLPGLPINEDGKTNRYVDLSFDNNNANSLYDALVDINTAAAIRKINAVINSEGFRKIFPSSKDAKIVKDRLVLMVNNFRNKTPFVESNDLTDFVSKLNRIASIGVGQALAGVSQPIKQVIPVALNTIINSGGKLNLGYFADPARYKFVTESGYSIANRGSSAQTQIESLNRMIEQASNSKGESAMRLLEDISKKWLNIFLVQPDVYIARASWLGYYEKSLAKRGIKNIDYSSHVLDKEAADYAQSMVDRQQNISDHDLAAPLYASRDKGQQLLVKIFAAFSSFRTNASVRLANDLSVLEYWNTSTKEDKEIAIRSLAGYAVETATFHLTSLLISYLTNVFANQLLGVDDDDEEDKYNKMLLKGRLTNVAIETISPFPLLDAPIQIAEHELISMAQDILGMSEEEKINIFGKKSSKDIISDLVKSLGMFGVSLDRANILAQMISLSSTGQYKDNYGKLKFIKESDRNAISTMIPFVLMGSVNAVPGAEIMQTARRMIKISESQASTNNPNEVTPEERKIMEEIDQLEYIKRHYKDVDSDETLTFKDKQELQFMIDKKSSEIAEERDIKQEKFIKSVEESEANELKSLLGEYNTKTEMKSKNPDEYDRKFGPGSRYYKEHASESKIKKLWKRVKKTWK